MTTRRDLLRGGLAAGVLACWRAAEPLAGGPEWRQPVPGGEPAGLVPFRGEGDAAVGVRIGVGHFGRLAVDLSTLDDGTIITPTDEFFIRTGAPDLLPSDRHQRWTIRVHGLVERPGDVPLAELERFVEPQGEHLIECSGNSRQRAFGLISVARWEGIPVAQILERVRPQPGATRVLISGFDQHREGLSPPSAGASWIFTRDEIESAGAFLATRMNGQPLPDDHGFPVRLVVPGWYGCCMAKWVDEIALVSEAAPATSQMREYASRTHQQGIPELARDFAPARLEVAAMPVRVEHWRVGGRSEYRLHGILWGGLRPTRDLRIRFTRDQAPEPVQTFAEGPTRRWTLWTHRWRPAAPGDYVIELEAPDVPSRRLESRHYARSVRIEHV